MSESTKVILIRHGETEWNLSGRWQGHADSPLSPRGVSQAIALGERMSNESLDHFYTSDLERAQHTARLIGEPSGWLANPMESLRERDLGVLEGLTTDEMIDKFPNEYHSFRNEGPDYQIPHGESFRQFCDRCDQALEEISARHPGERIGLVTHGGFLGAIFRYVLKIPLDAERNYVLLNCSINRLEKTDKGWNLVSWGDIAHLDGLDSLDDA